MNKASYLKPGSRIAKSGTENLLFDNLFEIILSEDYEENFDMRDKENERKELNERK